MSTIVSNYKTIINSHLAAANSAARALAKFGVKTDFQAYVSEAVEQVKATYSGVPSDPAGPF